MALHVSTCQIYSTASHERFRHVAVTVEGFISTSADGAFISDSVCPDILIGLGVSDNKSQSDAGIGELLDYMAGKQLPGEPSGKRVKFTLAGKIEYHAGVPVLYVDSVVSRAFVD